MPWLLHYKANDRPTTRFMKFVVSLEMHLDSIWGTCSSCKNLQEISCKGSQKDYRPQNSSSSLGGCTCSLMCKCTSCDSRTNSRG